MLDEFSSKIKSAIQDQQPLHFTVPFGGYKLWRLPSYPNPDWSEVFNIRQLISYLYPLSLIHRSGIILEYFSDEIMVGRMNNIPQSDLDSYNSQMASLVEWFDQSTPDNFQLRFSKIRDQIDQTEYWKRIDAQMDEIVELWDKQPDDVKQIRLKKSARNYRGNLAHLSQEETDKILLRASLYHDGFIFADWREGVPWAFDDHMIALGFRYTDGWAIPVKSSRASVCQFWVGTGVLRQRGEELITDILTNSQYQKVKEKLITYHTSIFPKHFTNLMEVPVLAE